MRNWVIAIIVCFCLFQKAEANSYATKKLFEVSNSNLLNGDYSEALAGYHQLENSGYKSVGLYCNMGDAYFKTRQYALSLLYFEKGIKLSPADTQLTFNKRKVLAKLPEDAVKNNSAFDTRKSDFFDIIDPLNKTAIIALVIVNLLFVAFLLYNRSRLKTFSGNFFKISSAVCLVVIAGAYLCLKVYRAQKFSIVVSQDSPVYLGPDKGSKTSGTMPAGYKVQIINQYNGWFEVRDYKNTVSWISSDNLREID